MDKKEAEKRAQELLDYYGSGIFKGYEEITMPDGRPGIRISGFTPSIKDMSTERDIHFQGFAKLLLPEISTRFFTLYAAIMDHKDIQEIDAIEDEIKQLIARRAYDLVLSIHQHDWLCHNPEETIKRDPDPTSWPTE